MMQSVARVCQRQLILIGVLVGLQYGLVTDRQMEP